MSESSTFYRWRSHPWKVITAASNDYDEAFCR